MNDPFALTDASGELAEPAVPDYIAALNPDQALAVQTLDGPVLVLSGAGTGKTRVLTSRLAHILDSTDTRSWQILAVTFTNRAAREMKTRVGTLLGVDMEGWWVGTFHALGARMLRANAERIGLGNDFTILDTDDQIRLIKQLAQELEINDKNWPARLLLAIIQRWKDRGLVPDKVPAEDAQEADGQALPLYRAYQARLLALNACDFGDLLLHCLTLFGDHPDVLEKYQRQFHHVLVDEYQDTNVAQYLWLRLLSMGHRNICCVGDDDQSIYSWRGAEIQNILRFEADFPDGTIVRLERNYRSTGNILGAASGLIAQNKDRMGKTLWTEDAAGDPVRVVGTMDGGEEATAVSDRIEALLKEGHDPGGIAVLVRTGFQTREFEERFINIGLPYRVIGGPRFYERREIRDALAYFRVVVQPSDDLAFERIINLPRRGVGAATLQTIHALARGEGMPMTAAVRMLVGTDELKPKMRRTLGQLMEDFARWRDTLDGEAHAMVAETILEESGYLEMWRQDKSIEAPGRLENLRELIVALEEYESLPAFLEHVSLVMENDNDDGSNKVSLMTLHGAKGLEFDTVFLPGWEEGLFPHQRAMDEGGEAALEEERRLAYVGLTRARHRSIVLYAANRRIFNQWVSALPSRFIDDLPEGHVEQDQPLHRRPLPSSRFDGRGRAFQRDGWDRGGFEGPVIDATAEVVAPQSRYRVGDRVFHKKFGYGRIRAVNANKLDVDFEKSSRKHVIDSFVEPAQP